MIIESKSTATELLEGWLVNRGLASRYEDDVNRNIRKGNSFYMKTRERDGVDAAERELAAWNRRLRRSDFAASIEVVARGMLAFASADRTGTYVQVVDDAERGQYPRHYAINGRSKMVVAFNPAPFWWGCASSPRKLEYFASQGTLPLRAVTLEAGDTRFGERIARLGLVLPRREIVTPDMSRDDGFVIITIDLTGHTNTSEYRLRVSPDNYLRYKLGLGKPERAVDGFCTSGLEIDVAAGFPGATQYLADVIGMLEDYFVSLAEVLDDPDA